MHFVLEYYRDKKQKFINEIRCTCTSSNCPLTVLQLSSRLGSVAISDFFLSNKYSEGYGI